MQNISDQDRSLLFAAEHDEIVPVVDLHGLSEHEALRELDLFLDRAFHAGERTVKIVHGSGTGKLREAVWKVLECHAFVKVHAPASPPLGAGVTVVVMRGKG